MISEAIRELGVTQGFVLHGAPKNATEFAASFQLIIGVDASQTAILSNDLSGFGITWEQISSKVSELQAAYDAQAYARKREAEYPSIQELVVALYDTDDRAAIEAKRAAVKAKYPKG